MVIAQLNQIFCYSPILPRTRESEWRNDRLVQLCTLKPKLNLTQGSRKAGTDPEEAAVVI